MGVMKQMWSDNFTENTRVSVRLKQKLPEGPWMSYVQPQITMAVACRHEWNQVVGIYKVYENCKHCGIAKEVLGAANS